MTCPYRETRIDMSPPEPIAWDVCSARDSPSVTYACCAENCTCFGPWGAWRSFVSPYCQSWALLCDTPDRLAANMAYVFLVMYASEEFGWTP